MAIFCAKNFDTDFNVAENNHDDITGLFAIYDFYVYKN